MTRPDALPKAEGRVEFGADLSAPRMLWAAYATAPHPHARLRSLSVDEALATPGVRAVLTAADLSALLPKRKPDPQRPLLVAKESRFQGEPFALVAAEDLATARAAARRVRADWEVLPAFTDLTKELPSWPTPEVMKGDDRVNAHVLASRGDFEKACRDADVVHDETYRTNMVAQVPMEPHACLARVRGEDWHVRTTTQTPFGLREDLVDKLGLPTERVRVEGTWVGGGFGGKNEALLEAHALLLSKRTGRPVRLALTFREEFLFSRTTQPAVFQMTSCVRGGRLIGRRTRLLLDTGASLPGRDFALGYALGFTLGPYRLDAWELEGYALRTHRPPFGPHRAPLAPQCSFAAESHLDSLARRIGVDPIAFRRQHVWEAGEKTAFGQEVPPFAAAEALARGQALERSWRAELPPGGGIGIAVGFWSTGTGAGGEAIVRLCPTGLTIVQGEREIGTGSVCEATRAIASRVTGLPMEAVQVEYLDTSRAPFDSGVWGSRTTIALGRAVQKACEALLHDLGRRGLGLGRGHPRQSRRGAPEVRLELFRGRVMVRQGELARPLVALLTSQERKRGGVEALGKEYGRSHDIDRSVVKDGELYPYSDLIASVHLAQVAVDRDTGAVRVERYAAFQDAGHVVDPEGYRGQVEGAVLMGLGTALTEEGLLTPQGRLQNPGLLDYRIPTIRDVPSELQIVAIEGHPGSGPWGAKGVGEPPIIPVPAAVANALADATGARVLEIPLTPERVARALGIISARAPTQEVPGMPPVTPTGGK
ncbi:MAG: xanthine dehydrogenase family protein [Euryarchaeota archaeon]|nr:xanthine dehydrogenase family protein [Euryarchaeota archaeon]MDE1835553.1 xanthine dehydrogenase family protein [Euryarchaeota archaeon]MDE1879644.1 xanthine dehydrogenase family protein [Euryarchaeota archaeon]MDE2043825.1 xanthine dehydrogenase family protein [Thermoplasmata archaeon]